MGILTRMESALLREGLKRRQRMATDHDISSELPCVLQDERGNHVVTAVVGAATGTASFELKSQRNPREFDT